MKRLSELPDEELLRIYLRRRRLAWALYYAGCLSTIAGFLVTWVLTSFANALGIILLGLAVFAGGGYLISQLHNYTSLVELLFERGLVATVSVKYLKKRLSEILVGTSHPRLVLALQGRGLPHGGEVNAILQLNQDLTSGEIEMRCVGHEGTGKPEFRKAVLTGERCLDLSKKVEDFLKESKTGIRFPVMDGFPCDLVIGLSEPRVLKTAECNLADPSTNQPILTLAKAIYEAASQFKETTMIVGSCDDHGNVDIRPM